MISLFRNPAKNLLPQPAQLPASTGSVPALSQTAALARVNPLDALNARALKPRTPFSFAAPWRGLKWLQMGRPKKRLQMLETVPLGDKRFVALVQVDGRQFLIGGAPSNVGMLAELSPDESFHQVIKDATQGLGAPVAVATSVPSKPLIAAPKLAAPAASADNASVSKLIAQAQKAHAPEVDLPEDDSFSFSSSLAAAMKQKPETPVAAEAPVEHHLEVAAPKAPAKPRKPRAPRKPKAATPVAAAPAISNFTFQVPHLISPPAKTAKRKTTRRKSAAQQPQGVAA